MVTKLLSLINNKYIVITIVFYIFVSCLLLNPDLPVGGDCPYYLILAQSIASGQGYKDIYYPGNPPNTSYPFFYPLLLSLILAFFPKTVIGLKFVSVIFGTASLVAIYILFSDKHHRGTQNTKFVASDLKPVTYNLERGTWNWLLLLLVATNLWFLGFSALIMTEMVYIFFSLMTLLLLEKYGGQSRLFDKTLFIAAFSMAITFFTKPIALSISVAVFVHFMIKREYRKGFLLMGLWFFLISPWIYRNIVISRTDASCNYFVQFSSGQQLSIINIGKRIIWNIVHYSREIPSLLFPAFFLNSSRLEMPGYFWFLYGELNELKPSFFQLPHFLVILLAIFFCVTILWGFMFQFGKKRLIEKYVFFYISILMLFPSRFYIYSANRYLLPLLPFILDYFLRGFFSVLKKSRLSRLMIKRSSLFVIFIIFITGLLCDSWLIKRNIGYILDYNHLSNVERKDYYNSWYDDYFIAGEWVKKNTFAHSVVMHHYPAPFYLYGERKTVFFNISHLGSAAPRRSFKEIKETVKQKEVDYIVTKEEEEENIIDELNKECRNIIFHPLVEFKSKYIDYDYLARVYKVARIRPETKLLNGIGKSLYNREKYDEAIEKFKDALKYEPHFVIYYNLGQSYEKKGLREEALKMYKKSIKLQPNYQTAKNRFNIISQRKVVQKEPYNALAWGKLGKYFLRNYEYKEATKAFKKALDIDSGLAKAYYNLGISYINEEKYVEAITEFQKAFKLEPELRYKIRHYVKIAKKKEKETMIYAISPKIY